MGLFSNNKKLCPICGSPTPRLLATKVADMPLCKACADKVDLPGGALDRMSLEQFQQYIAYYDDNKALRDQFRETKRMSFGFLSGDLLVDEEHRLLRLKGYDGALVFPAAALKSFRFMEDGKTLFEGKPDGLHCFHSDVPERARALQPRIERFLIQKEEHERMERMERMLDRRERRSGEPDDHRPDIPAPRFDVQAPVQRFGVEVTLDDPYWKSFRDELNAPDFNSFDPSVNDYLCDYDNKVSELHDMAFALARVMNPAAREIWDNDAAAAPAQAAAPIQAAAPAVDTVAELQKYKMLLDTGVLTEEEFAAKKKQLLGI